MNSYECLDCGACWAALKMPNECLHCPSKNIKLFWKPGMTSDKPKRIKLKVKE